MTAAITAAGITPGQFKPPKDEGDLVQVLFRPGVPKNRLLHPLVPQLAARLHAHNVGVPERERMRLRVVIDAGDLRKDAFGCYGVALDEAYGLVNSQELRACLAKSAAPLVLLVSPAIYEGIVRQEYEGIDPATYQPVTVRLKQGNAAAWCTTRTPERPRDPQPCTARGEWSLAPSLRRRGRRRCRGRLVLAFTVKRACPAVLDPRVMNMHAARQRRSEAQFGNRWSVRAATPASRIRRWACGPRPNGSSPTSAAQAPTGSPAPLVDAQAAEAGEEEPLLALHVPAGLDPASATDSNGEGDGHAQRRPRPLPRTGSPSATRPSSSGKGWWSRRPAWYGSVGAPT